MNDEEQQAELRGSQACVGELHLSLEMAVDVDVDAKHEVRYQGHHGKGHVYQGTGANAYEHDSLVYYVYVVVYIETVGLPLGVPYTCKGAVHGISEPVNQKAEA